MRPAVTPTGVERRFDDDDIIVTKTDLKGRITYANDVFLQVSCYAEHEVLGKPHSLIRHPDMPRAVFQLLWDRLGRAEEIFAYVVNLASDGAHYWVLAHITPTVARDGRVVGYHSNRRTPYRPALPQVTSLYATLRHAERGLAGRDAAAASTALLDAHLEAAGMGYDEWIWSVEPAGALA